MGQELWEKRLSGSGASATSVCSRCYREGQEDDEAKFDWHPTLRLKRTQVSFSNICDANQKKPKDTRGHSPRIRSMGRHRERTSQRSDPMGKTHAPDEQVLDVVALDAAHAEQHKVRVQVGSGELRLQQDITGRTLDANFPDSQGWGKRFADNGKGKLKLKALFRDLHFQESPEFFSMRTCQ